MSSQIFEYIIVVCCIIQVFSQVVVIPQGIMIGSIRTNRDGGIYYSFQKIPYAKPPLGELRFKAPLSASCWSGTWDATQDFPECVQPGKNSTMEGQEDCLYLNVYTPALPIEDATKKAVMVFIHGGLFDRGSASESTYGGQFLLTKDVVLVVLNYRLGVFGFLSLDDTSLDVTGNTGLKDQVLALEWIRDNIEYFGGDPNNVLLFGEGTGSRSTHLHMMSPKSKGLFHKAIAQSGSCLTPIGMSPLRNNGEYLGSELGIQTENWDEMLTSLQEVSAEELYAAEQALTATHASFISPIVEVSSDDAFIQVSVLDTILNGSYNQVPFMTGVNDADGLIFEFMSLQQTGETLLLTNFSQFIPADLNIVAGSEDEECLSQRIKEFYFGDSEPSGENLTGTVTLYTDYAFAFPAHRSVLSQLNTTSYPIYLYVFTADTKLNQLKQQYNSTSSYEGAAHGEELAYLFESTSTPSDIEEGSDEDFGITTMVELWTNFAIYGNPTPENIGGVTWNPLEKEDQYYLAITSNAIAVGINPYLERMTFWEEIYNEYFDGVWL